jgi:hypothetical protein
LSVRRLRRSSPPVASFAFSRLGVPDSSAASPVMVDSTLAPAPAYAWMVLLPPRPEDRRSLDRQALPKLRCDRTSDAAEVDVTGRVFRASCLVRLARSHFTYGGFSPRGRRRLASRHHPPPGPPSQGYRAIRRHRRSFSPIRHKRSGPPRDIASRSTNNIAIWRCKRRAILPPAPPA